jgi:hypothetical protein
MLGMAKEPPKKPKPSRSGVPLHVWIDEEIAGALQDYLDETDPSIFKTSAVEAALRDFLRKQGHWPRKPRQEEGE